MKRKAWQNPLEMYENWKIVQQLEHDAQQDYLQRRVELQRQLIHAVGKLEQERKKHDEERRHRVYQKHKEDKKAQADKLEQVCLSAMATEREAKRGRSPGRAQAHHRRPKAAAQGRKPAPEAASRSPSSHSQSDQSDVSESDVHALHAEEHALHAEEHAQHAEKHAQHAEFQEPETLQERTEIDEHDALPTNPVDLDAMPLYQSYLHRQFGSDVADGFLRPKFSNSANKNAAANGRSSGTKQSTFIQSLTPAMREKCRIGGVATVWDIMARRTQKRLLRVDAQIPQSWKDTYRAFMIEQATHGRLPPVRSFCEREDLPELPRLLDDSARREVKSYQRVVEAMYRIAKETEDRSRLMMEKDSRRELANSGDSCSPNQARRTPHSDSVLDFFGSPDRRSRRPEGRAGRARVQSSQSSAYTFSEVEDVDNVVASDLVDMRGAPITAADAVSPRLRFVTARDLRTKTKKYAFGSQPLAVQAAPDPTPLVRSTPADISSPKPSHAAATARSSLASQWTSLRLDELAGRARILVPTNNVADSLTDGKRDAAMVSKSTAFKHGSKNFWNLSASRLSQQ